MFEFHTDKKRYFDMQRQVTKNYILPFIKMKMDLEKPLNVLEIGCAEAGVLSAFTALGHTCTGIELNASRIETAKSFMTKELESGQINFICRNIYDIENLQVEFFLVFHPGKCLLAGISKYANIK